MKKLLSPCQAEIIIKKSKFICQIVPVETEEEANEFIASVKKEHYKATHNVPVYVLGNNYEKIKYSDDGEPSGTAAKPMLGVVQSRELINVAMVVTRYFGGIKLGTGGLVRAYSGAVIEALEQADIAELDNYVEFSFNVPYSKKDIVEYELNNIDGLTYDITYTDVVGFHVTIRACLYDDMVKTFTSKLSGEYEEESHRDFFSKKAKNICTLYDVNIKN